MRNLLLSIYVIGAMISCQMDEPDPVIVSEPINLDDVPLTWQLDSIPLDTLSHYYNSVFVNAFGDEKYFTVLYTRQTGVKKINNVNAPYEVVLINFIDFVWSEYDMNIYAYSGYEDTTAVGSLIVLFYMAADSSQSKIYFPQGLDPVPNRYFPELEILDHTFYRVHSNALGQVGSTSGEIYFTTSQGIVGFRGENGEYWRLKRWE